MQQLQATWLSAFCTFTGLVMHPDKTNATTLGMIPNEQPPKLFFYDHQWNSHQCMVDMTMKQVKYLGIDLDLRNNTNHAYTTTLQSITSRLSHLLLQPGSPTCKIDYIRGKILPIALYTATSANWTLAQYRELDKPLSAAYRKILSMPAHCAESLLYIPQSKCGIGLPRLSDRAQMMKWATFQRCMAVGRTPNAAVRAFLDRIPQLPTSPDCTLRELKVSSWNKVEPLTARSLVEWASESNLCLAERINQTPPEQRQLTLNTTEAERLAKNLQLWPDPEIWFEQELPEIDSFYTDGSYEVHPTQTADIITPEHLLRDSGLGAGGIVFVPTDPLVDPHLIRLTSTHPDPGMNAYSWELVSQLVGLHLAKHLPPDVHGYTDCAAAMARTNRALQTRHDQLANTRAGIYSSAVHNLAQLSEPRLFNKVKSHPERDKEREKLDNPQDCGIFMADCVAEGDMKTMRKKGFCDRMHTLNFDNILSEVLPLHQWHFRATNDGRSVPVLDDIINHQHHALLHNYTEKRDLSNTTRYWSSTAFDFANKVNPLKDTSSWTATRRTLIVFDWLGHGRNLAKMSNTTVEERTRISQCKCCGQPDSRHHSILECTNPQFAEIRATAKIQQHKVAAALIKANKNIDTQRFIQSICTASWTQTQHLERIWFGTWTTDTLQSLLHQPLTAPITSTQRYNYITITRKLTSPLINAYSLIANIIITRRDAAHNTTHHADIGHPQIGMTIRERLEHQATHPQDPTTHDPSLLNRNEHVTTTNPFTLSDSAFRLTEAEDGR